MTTTKNRAVKETLLPPIDTEIENRWVEAAEWRVARLEEGKAKLIPGDEVFTKIRKFDLSKMVAGLPRNHKTGEEDWGAPAGKEIW